MVGTLPFVYQYLVLMILRESTTQGLVLSMRCVSAGHSPLYEDPDDEEITMDSFK